MDPGSGGAIPEVALRITALRETFEETGLLLGVVLCDGKVICVFFRALIFRRRTVRRKKKC